MKLAFRLCAIPMGGTVHLLVWLLSSGGLLRHMAHRAMHKYIACLGHRAGPVYSGAIVQVM